MSQVMKFPVIDMVATGSNIQRLRLEAGQIGRAHV